MAVALSLDPARQHPVPRIDLSRRAAFSPCRRYRYSLWREIDMFDPRCVLFIGLNPSTATAYEDDPTCRREIDFATRLGYGHYCKANLFGWRATLPSEMLAAADPIGPDNDAWLDALVRQATLVVAAWGAHGHHQGRAKAFLASIPNVPIWCYGKNKDGSPCHPLYLPASRSLVRYR